MKLSLYYPVKPYRVNQAWGIYNPAYEQFGFNHHNGIDMATSTSQLSHAMCDGEIMDVGYIPTGSGNYVKLRTGPIECEGETCLVEFYYMHAEKVLVKPGDRVKAGDVMTITDNTGFSTGQHLHISAYRFALDGVTRIDVNPPYNNTIDFSKYFNGLYAEDIGKPTTAPILEPAHLGETNINVHNIQEKLISLGYSIPAGATGFYGPQTKAAVYAFQLDKVGLSLYEKTILRGSTVGPKTLAALNL